MKKAKKFLLMYIILIIVFIGLLVVTCSFPSSAIKSNVQSSSKTLNEEGNRKLCYIFDKFQIMEFDNYSDSLMINTAYSIDSKTPLYSAFTAKKDYIPGVTKSIKEDVVGELKYNSKYSKHDEVSELEDTVNGVGEESFEYAKYWHGYLTVLRPLLLVMDYQQIRVLITLILALLAIFVTTTIAEKKNNIIATFYLLSLVFVEYFFIGLSLINSVTFLITMLASSILVSQFDKITDWGIFFFVTGMVGGFFSLLDAPLLTVGSLLILYFVFKNGNGKDNLKEMIKLFTLWLIGYVITWFTKWVLMDLIFHRNLIKTAICQVFYRTVGAGISPLYSICFNLLLMALPIVLVSFIIVYIYVKNYKRVCKETRKKARIFIIISVLPFIWYLIFTNHSTYHFFFTYRIQFVSMFAILLWVYYICGEKSNK